ncbi:MAG: molybdopterin-dependent oxidoreductase [Peptococcaceae bacterium]|nr:molybdopterin-dependent oxidoreductase [Peptococcaceae bacterium]
MVRRRGIGMASVFYGTGYGNGFPDISSAIVELHPSGKATVRTGAVDCGQGSSTVFAIIAAEVLGLQVSDITVTTGDTDNTPDTGTTAATRQTYNTGNAVRLAALDALSPLLDMVKPRLAVNTVDGLVVRGGAIEVRGLPGRKVTLAEAVALAKAEGLTTMGKATFTAHTTALDPENGQGAPYWPYAFATHMAEVEVDTLTGMVEVLRVVAAHDVGRAINRAGVEGQVEGGVAQGLGFALLEEVQLNCGRIQNPNLAGYLVPTAMDMAVVESIIVEHPEPSGPFGAKGIGEPAILPVAPAILNAIFDAVGVRITDLPATPEKVLQAIKLQEDRGIVK